LTRPGCGDPARDQGRAKAEESEFFGALVVVGVRLATLAFGLGKAKEVPMAIRKAIEQAKKNLISLNLKGTTDSAPGFGLVRIGPRWLLKPAPDALDYRRRSGARRDGSCGNFQRADEINWHIEPAQRHQGHVLMRCCASRTLPRSRNTLENRGGTRALNAPGGRGLYMEPARIRTITMAKKTSAVPKN